MKRKRERKREEKREREGEVENHENKSKIFFLMKKGKCSMKVRAAKLQMEEKGVK